MVTEVIMPRQVRVAVSMMLSPAKIPVVGPMTNLNMLTIKTVKYLKILSPIQRFIWPEIDISFSN
jgi:hypothetical protein